MNITFNSIQINGFMSLVNEKIDLQNLGVVTVKGINQYDPLFKSNGSGKSAIFDSILWCLTGLTSRGSTNVVNRNIPDCTTSVTLELDLDNDHFSITRTQNSKSKALSIIKNGDDISGSTFTKSKDVLKDQLSFVNYEVLTSIIILSQGLPSRLSSLRPSDRKSRLEYLSNTDGILGEIQVKMNEAYSRILNESTEANTTKTKIDTTISSNQVTVDSCNRKITEIEEYRKSHSNLDEDSIRLFNSKIVELQDAITPMRTKYRELVRLEDELRSKKSKASSELASVQTQIAQLSIELKSVSSNICPTCKSVLTSADDLKNDLITRITALKKRYEELTKELESYDTAQVISSFDYNEKINDYNKKLLDLTRMVDEYNRMQSSIDSFIESRTEALKIIEDKTEESVSINQELQRIARITDIYNFYKSAISRKFRNFLLDGTVAYLNQRLEYYSKYLFSNGQVVRLENTGNNIDIRLGDSYFEDLSGGEGRRVDIILQLAQRDLSKAESGFTCNLLVLDEVLDYLDSDGITSVLSMLEEESSYVDTMMIVTHRDELSVPNDSEIVVIKDQNQLSRISK